MGGQHSNLGCPGPDCFPSKDTSVMAVANANANANTIVGPGEYRRMSPAVKEIELKRAQQYASPTPVVQEQHTRTAAAPPEEPERVTLSYASESNRVVASTTPIQPLDETKDRLRTICQHPFSLVSTMRRSDKVQAQEFVWTLRSDLQGFKSLQAMFKDKVGGSGSSECTDACRQVESKGKTLVTLEEIVEAFQDALNGKKLRPDSAPALRAGSPRMVDSNAVDGARAASMQVPLSSPAQPLRVQPHEEQWGQLEHRADSASVMC